MSERLSRNFLRSEFACRCGCGKADINLHLVARLQMVRDAYGPMRVTSGFRCLTHNRAIGSNDTSAHVTGDAVDIACPDSASRFRLVDLARSAGICRIGIHKTFVHLDISESLPTPALWLY